MIVVFNLSTSTWEYTVGLYDNVVYISLPRKLYNLVSKIIRWGKHYDLNPLMKLTHYIDELLAVARLHRELGKAEVVLVFGSMSLSSFIARLLGVRKPTIVYDPLANYAQTLYLRSRRSLLELLRYGLYLALHKLEVRASNIVVYPSKVDLENAKRMFKPAKAIIVPNPSPICYSNLKEYLELRGHRTDYSRPYFILLAGSRGRTNEEAVKITIKVFNRLPPDRFKLLITGPWQDMRKYVENTSIELLGVVPKEKLKELLAISDYGLAPVFSHSAGTFLKTLTYISAGLDIITSTFGVVGVNIPKGINIYLVKNKQELVEVVGEIVYRYDIGKGMNSNRLIALCERTSSRVEDILKLVENPRGG
jgi:glycosyltransferase involved in cell wall biosynthesis